MRRGILGGFAVAMAIASTGWLAPVREVPATAHRFVCYMNAMERSGQKLNFWDRVTYGLALAGAPEKATRPVGRI